MVLTMPNLALLGGSGCLRAPNCYQKEQQIFPYFDVDGIVDINAV
jgi:hypothetical protein